MSGQKDMAIMQSHKKRKKCVTKKVNVTTATTLFPVAVLDCSTVARKSHAGYFHLLFIHFKHKIMSATIESSEILNAPSQRVYVRELYEYITYNTSLKTHVIGTIEGNGIIDASMALEATLSDSEHIVSISLQPVINEL